MSQRGFSRGPLVIGIVAVLGWTAMCYYIWHPKNNSTIQPITANKVIEVKAKALAITMPECNKLFDDHWRRTEEKNALQTDYLVKTIKQTEEMIELHEQAAGVYQKFLWELKLLERGSNKLPLPQ